jgi:hypothetical protein
MYKYIIYMFYIFNAALPTNALTPPNRSVAGRETKSGFGQQKQALT